MPGVTYPIKWTSRGSVGADVDINLLKGGTFHSQISTQTSNDGLLSWAIPGDLPPGDDYQVKIISCAKPACFDLSWAFSIISGDAIEVIWPNGGESATPGSTCQIRWAWIGNPGANVKIDLFKDGKFYRQLSASTPNDGAFDWDVASDLPSGIDHDIRIVSTTDPTCADQSDNTFAIYTGDARAARDHWARYE